MSGSAREDDGAGRPFLTADWRWLAMLNYEVEPAALEPLVPRGTELDAFDGRTMVSIVGFRFVRTRVMGVPVPLHRDFDEVNLRFYVRRRAAEGWRRAVVFVRELVPRAAIAWSARLLYNEPYLAVPMRHEVAMAGAVTGAAGRVRYAWRHRGRWAHLAATVAGRPALPDDDSEAAFIAEHYWGYTRQRDGGTIEYAVRHPPWRVWRADTSELNCDVASLYGSRFVPALAGAPCSSFVAEGSAVTVHAGRRIA